MAVVRAHDKEGYVELKNQEVPFLQGCSQKYGVVFTQVAQINFVALCKQVDQPEVSATIILTDFEIAILD